MFGTPNPDPLIISYDFQANRFLAFVDRYIDGPFAGEYVGQGQVAIYKSWANCLKTVVRVVL